MAIFWREKDDLAVIVPKLFDKKAQIDEHEVKKLREYLESWFNVFCGSIPFSKRGSILEEIRTCRQKSHILEVTMKLLKYNIDPW